MSTAEIEKHSSEQREEQNTLLRSLLGVVKGMGMALGLLIISGVGVAIADHFKLNAVVVSVSNLTTTTEKSAEAVRLREDTLAIWRNDVNLNAVSQKAETSALTNRIRILESELRTANKPQP